MAIFLIIQCFCLAICFWYLKKLPLTSIFFLSILRLSMKNLFAQLIMKKIKMFSEPELKKDLYIKRVPNYFYFPLK